MHSEPNTGGYDECKSLGRFFTSLSSSSLSKRKQRSFSAVSVSSRGGAPLTVDVRAATALRLQPRLRETAFITHVSRGHAESSSSLSSQGRGPKRRAFACQYKDLRLEIGGRKAVSESPGRSAGEPRKDEALFQSRSAEELRQEY